MPSNFRIFIARAAAWLRRNRPARADALELAALTAHARAEQLLAAGRPAAAARARRRGAALDARLAQVRREG